MTDPFDDFVARLEAAGCEPEEGPNGQWGARCPVPGHGGDEDGRPSLSFKRGTTKDVVANCHAGCPWADISRTINVGRPEMPKRLLRGDHLAKRRGTVRGRMVASYRYTDIEGNLLYEVVRFDPKDFRPRWWDGWTWHWNLEGRTRVLYRLPEVFHADPDVPVFLVEGEKDADNLAALGLLATTNAGGAKAWDPKKHPDLVRALAGRVVVVIPDNDRAGREGAKLRAGSLAEIAESVRVLELPGLDAHGDVSDWLEAGGTAEKLLALVGQTPEGTEATGGQIAALDQLAGMDPAEAIRFGLSGRDVVDELARAEESDFELALLSLKDRGAKAAEVEALKRTVVGRRRELRKIEREAALREEVEQEVSVDDLLREVAGKWVDEEERLHDLAGLLNEVVVLLRRYVWFPRREQAHAVALWVTHTYCIDGAWTSPRLSIRGPSMRCGKTRLLEVLEQLVFEPLSTVNMTPPVLFRLVGGSPRTVLLDEIDTIFGPKAAGNEELRGLIDAGQRRGGKVYRLEGDTAHGYRAAEFPVFGAVALTGIGRLPGTIEDRSILIELARKQRKNRVARFRASKVERVAGELRQRLAAWAVHHVEELREADPALPEELSDRAQDGWEPLLAIADAAGEHWAARARKAARALMPREEVDDSDPLLLLADIRRVFVERGWPPAMFTIDLLSDLRAIEESPWVALHRGDGIRAHDLARLLREFKVRPEPVFIGGKQLRGYQRQALEDSWTRYLGPLENGHTREFDGTPPQINRQTVKSAGQSPDPSVNSSAGLDGPKEPLTRTFDGLTDENGSVPEKTVTPLSESAQRERPTTEGEQ